MTKLKYLLVGVISGAILMFYFHKPETKIQEVEIVKEKIKIVKSIITKPDGTKIEYINKVEYRDLRRKKTTTKVASRKYALGLSQALYGARNNQPIYGGDLSLRVLPRLSVVAYGRTDGELGLGVRYEF